MQIHAKRKSASLLFVSEGASERDWLPYSDRLTLNNSVLPR